VLSKGCKLHNTIFSRSALPEVSFDGQTLVGTVFKGAGLKDTSFKNAILRRVSFDNMNVTKAHFDGAVMDKLTYAVLQGLGRVRVYRLWVREDAVPHKGQDAVEDVVRRVKMISSATSTPSTWTLGRSRKMIIGCLLVLEQVGKSEKMFNLLLYYIADQQGCVRFRLRFSPFEQYLCCSLGERPVIWWRKIDRK